LESALAGNPAALVPTFRRPPVSHPATPLPSAGTIGRAPARPRRWEIFLPATNFCIPAKFSAAKGGQSSNLLPATIVIF